VKLVTEFQEMGNDVVIPAASKKKKAIWDKAVGQSNTVLKNMEGTSD
jgi:hypothetical protein